MKHLAYKKFGKGFPIVLIHGYLGGPLMWQFQIEALKKDYEVITPCLAGYAESSLFKAPNTINENAKLVLELLNHLKINNFYLLGHSMGGMIVQEIAAMNIMKVEKLICYGTGPIGTLPSRFETIEETRKKILKIGIESLREEIAKTWFVDYENSKGYPICLQEGKKATEQAALASLNAWEKWDGCEQLSKIDCPTLIIWSDKDKSYDWAQQKALKQGIKHCEIVVIKDCAHNAHMEKPKKFNEILLNFINKKVI